MRKGSALLIVLGMISFMLFSGIAFSVYMRQTRLPSTFLRRTTVTRQLAKAALAEAIEDIDAAIANDPHPGVRTSDEESSTTGDDEDITGNYWNHRVLVRNKVYADNDEGYSGDDTISTLTLEGLAYLPPSLINEARYYSRHTPTAKWQRFRFDAGRYAYCAIDVSDYFDVNRILADRPRSSASSRRVTLAHVFEKSVHETPSSGEAEDWDDWLENDGKVRTVDPDTDRITFDGKMPLVSLADFNLLLGSESFGLIKSPFVSYIDSSSSPMYGKAANDDSGQEAEAYRSMTFVTDSLFRQTTDGEKDLESGDNQPFTTSLLKKSGRSKWFSDVFGTQSSNDDYLNFLGNMGMLPLFDYLDEDSIPVSLAIPTMEKIPMISAIDCKVSDGTMEFTVEKEPAIDDSTKQAVPTDGTGPTDRDKRVVTRWDKIYLNGAMFQAMMANLKVGALFPFVHEKSVTTGNFKLDGKIALYFTKAGDQISLNSEGSNSSMGLPYNVKDGCSTEDDLANGVLYLSFKDMAFTAETKNEDGTRTWATASKPNQLRQLSQFFKSGKGSTKYFLRVQRKWTETVSVDGDGNRTWPDGTEEPTPAGDASTIVDLDYRMPVLHGRGSRSQVSVYDKSEMLKLVQDDAEIKLNVAFWVRMRDKSDNVVDMVPAVLADDAVQRPGVSMSGPWPKRFAQRFGDGVQLLPFTASIDNGLHLAPWSLGSGAKKNVKFDMCPVVTADPRYNHRGENWFKAGATGDDLATLWWDNRNCSGNLCDGDCSMAVSDQGYLQSIYELGHLPRLSDPVGSGDTVKPNVDTFATELLKAPDATRTEICGSFTDTSNQDLAWKTYRVFGDRADPFYAMEFVSGLKGLKVNPYSDSIEILSAAFANTPMDWAHSSTNATMNPASQMGTDEFNKSYAWNAYNTGTTKLMWDDVQMLAEAYYDKVRTSPYSSGDWESAFEDLPWSYDKRKLIDGGEDSELDSSSSDLCMADKEFLYGFWHDCFAANQQLFLVFVRAEPMMMGGGIAGNAPPQLSSRAVALVWRDPEGRKSGNNSGSRGSSYMPHGLRVLFYHPLD